MYFNKACLNACNCKFEIDKMNPHKIRSKIDEITRNEEKVNRFFKDLNVENMKLVKPTFEAYMEKAGELHE